MISFTSVGKISVFKDSEEFFRAHNGYLLSDYIGGPTAADHLAKTYEAREDDIIVASFPKTGTTWLQELVYLIGSDLNFESTKSQTLSKRFPYMEFVYGDDKRIDASKLPSPRFLKFHYPYTLLPESIIAKKCKIFSPIRNPKDTVVSYYYFSKMNKVLDFTENLSTFVDYFVNDSVHYSPYGKYILEFWEKRHEENIFLVSYEEMSRDIVSVIRNISRFLGKSLCDSDIARIVDYCSFDNMKKNPSSNPDLTTPGMDSKISSFMRKGKVGDWKNHLTEEMNEKMDAYINKYFAGTGIDFIYE